MTNPQIVEKGWRIAEKSDTPEMCRTYILTKPPVSRKTTRRRWRWDGQLKPATGFLRIPDADPNRHLGGACQGTGPMFFTQLPAGQHPAGTCESSAQLAGR